MLDFYIKKDKNFINFFGIMCIAQETSNNSTQSNQSIYKNDIFRLPEIFHFPFDFRKAQNNTFVQRWANYKVIS